MGRVCGLLCLVHLGFLTGSLLGSTPAAAKEPVRICVDVEIKRYRAKRRRAARPRRKAPARRPRARPGPRRRAAAARPAPRRRGAAARPAAGARAAEGDPARETGARPAAGAAGPRPRPRPRAGAGKVLSPGDEWEYPPGYRKTSGATGRTAATRSTPSQRAARQRAARQHAARQRLAQRRARRRRARRRRARRPRYPYPPDAYLQRLVEHYVTHEPGYAAVDEGCTERITVELYPLKKGWTAFARYSGREREEKVDVLYYDELPRFAERVVAALLYGKDIATTATLRTVLQADSVRRYRTIKGLHYFSFAIGGAVRVAELPSYDRDNQAVSEKWRVLTPLTFAMGYRGRFNAWALDSYVRGSVGLQRLSLQADAGGNHVGHVDLGGMFDVALHFLRYYEPHGMISFYYGAGAQFDLTVLTSIRPSMADGERDQIVGGGLNVDLVIGFEFLRASGVQFFLQLVAAAPVWIFDNQSRYSRHIEAYTPEVGLALGILL